MSGKPYTKYIGEKFGKLTILGFKPGEYKNGKCVHVKANCKCDCGIIKWVDWSHLKMGKINSCGCLRDPSVSIGQKFGNFTVLEIIPHHYNKQGLRVLTKAKCKCVCGTVKTVSVNNLQAGNTISCGCIGRENIRRAAVKHGLACNPIYNLWHGINNRCYNKNLEAYKDYGGRGITNYWKDDVSGFAKYILQELGSRPSKKHSLDRINNDGNYEPGNLRWATYKQQANNKTHAFQRKIESLESRIQLLENQLKLKGSDECKTIPEISR
jgi:hypothetical protein